VTNHGSVFKKKYDPCQSAVASRGLSHFVVEEVLGHMALDALATNAGQTLENMPQHRLLSAVSESRKKVALSRWSSWTADRCTAPRWTPAATGLKPYTYVWVMISQLWPSLASRK
jgi:hypothetical protein